MSNTFEENFEALLNDKVLMYRNILAARLVAHKQGNIEFVASFERYGGGGIGVNYCTNELVILPANYSTERLEVFLGEMQNLNLTSGSTIWMRDESVLLYDTCERDWKRYSIPPIHPDCI